MAACCVNNKLQIGFILIMVAIALANIWTSVSAIPVGPNWTYVKNETAATVSAAKINTTGGSITTMVLNATTQNLRWKAYVGNVTGSLTLDDAAGFTIYDWTLSEIVGEVYATRTPNSINWARVNCSTSQNITTEEVAINHTNNPNDNISTTFNEQKHDAFFVGTVSIAANGCSSLHTYKNNTNQSADFEEMLLHDGVNMIYATILENNTMGYTPNQTYDFQMIVPEVALESWASSTAYYFYVELI